MKHLNRTLVLLGYTVYLYLLIKIILFKYAPVDAHLLWSQLQGTLRHPEFLQMRLDFANFTPFVSISRNLDHLSHPNDFVNLFGNIALFIPQGMFVRISGKGTVYSAFICSLGISLGLECSQLLLSMGSFDVDDLILNVLGGLIGYALLLRIPVRSSAPRKSSQT